MSTSDDRPAEAQYVHVQTGRDIDIVPDGSSCCASTARAARQAILDAANVDLGPSHAMGDQLGRMCGVPHGLTTCVVLPSVPKFNLPNTAGPQRRRAGAGHDD